VDTYINLSGVLFDIRLRTDTKRHVFKERLEYMLNKVEAAIVDHVRLTAH